MRRIDRMDPARAAMLILGFGLVVDRLTLQCGFHVRCHGFPGLIADDLLHCLADDLPSRQAEPCRIRLVASDVSSGVVDVRNQGGNRIADQLQLLFAMPQGLFNLLPLGNVDIDSKHPFRNSRSVTENLRACEQPVHGAVVPDNAEIMSIFVGGQCAFHRALRLQPVAGMNPRPPRFKRAFKGSGTQTIESLELD